MQLIQLQPRAAGDLHLIKTKKYERNYGEQKKKKKNGGGWGRGCCGVGFSLLSLSATSFPKINSRSFGGEDQNSCFSRPPARKQQRSAGRRRRRLAASLGSVREPRTDRLPRSISRQARGRPPTPPPPLTGYGILCVVLPLDSFFLTAAVVYRR